MRRDFGFSLFELLVVLVLLGLVTSIAAPSIEVLMRQLKVDEERRLLRQELYNRSVQAFTQERTLFVYFEGSRAVVTTDLTQSREDALLDRQSLNSMSFDYLSFPPSKLTLLPSGRSEPSNLRSIDGDGIEKIFEITVLLSGTEG